MWGTGLSALTLAGRAADLAYKRGLGWLGLSGLGLKAAEQAPSLAREYYDTGSVAEPVKSLVASLASQAAMGLITPEEFRWQLDRIVGRSQPQQSPIDALYQVVMAQQNDRVA